MWEVSKLEGQIEEVDRRVEVQSGTVVQLPLAQCLRCQHHTLQYPDSIPGRSLPRLQTLGAGGHGSCI